ncbi:MAG: hypothetical protein ABI068_10635 [Ktedonobacterales bacterium]
MRLDRVYSEGEALNALKQFGYEVREVENRIGLYEVTHPKLGGLRTMTVAQLCGFAEGAANTETMLRGAPVGV